MFLGRSDEAKFREDLFNIARTTLSSKVLSQDKEYFANLAVDAVLRLKVIHFLSNKKDNILTLPFRRDRLIWSTFRSSKKLVAN